MDFDNWFKELQEHGETLTKSELLRSSSWVGYSIKQSLFTQELWIDRFAAGQTPLNVLEDVLNYA